METLDCYIDRLQNEFGLNAFYKETRVALPAWCDEDRKARKQLIERLYARPTRVRELIWLTRNAFRDVFPTWN